MKKQTHKSCKKQSKPNHGKTRLISNGSKLMHQGSSFDIDEHYEI